MKVTVSPAVLRWARETALSSVEEAGRRIGKDAEVVAGWEAGSDRPTYAQLESLADAYGVSMNVFLLDDPPPDPGPTPDFRSGPHGGRPLSAGAARALRRADYIRGLAVDIGAIATPRLPHVGPNAPPSEIGAAVRAHLAVDIASQQAWPDERAALKEWRLACERAGVLVVQYRLAADDYRGCSLRGDATRSPVIVLNESDSPTGRIFTLFHELAHLVTGAAGAICDPLAWNPVAGGSPQERRMNAAAGHALVPADHLASLDVVHRLAEEPGDSRVLEMLGGLAGRYKISRQAMWYRLYESRIVEWQRFDALWPSLKAISKSAPSKDKKFFTPPRWERARRSYSRTVLQGLFSAEQTGRISTRSLVAAIDVPVDDLPRLEATVHQ